MSTTVSPPVPRNLGRYGWKPSLPDFRDLILDQPAELLAARPGPVDLRTSPFMPAVYDQLQLGSCTANSTSAAVQFSRRKNNLDPDFEPSRLFVYWNARALFGDTAYDGGSTVRDAMKGIARWGAPPDEVWPYRPARVLEQPPTDAYSAGLYDLATKYQRVRQAEPNIEHVLSLEFPVVFGFTAYDSFESVQVAATGIVPMPRRSEGVVGGHSMAIVGCEPDRRMFIVRNSWSTNWGMAGYCEMPYDYLLDPQLASDFWIVELTND